jgi:hypothetical protein
MPQETQALSPLYDALAISRNLKLTNPIVKSNPSVPSCFSLGFPPYLLKWLPSENLPTCKTRGLNPTPHASLFFLRIFSAHSCFLCRVVSLTCFLFFLYPLGDHSSDPSRLAEDSLGDNIFVATDLGANSPNDFEASYFMANSVALPKTKPTCHSL